MWPDESVATQRNQIIKAGFIFQWKSSTLHYIMKAMALSGIACVAERPLCQTESFSLGRHAFVPICASMRAGTLQRAPKWEKRAVQDLADTSEVSHYQELTMMVRIPSLAPSCLLRQTPPNCHKPRHLQGLPRVPSLPSTRQLPPRFAPLRLKSVRVFVYGPAAEATA